MSTLVSASIVWAGSTRSARLRACIWDRSPPCLTAGRHLALGSVGAWLSSTNLQDLWGLARAKYPPSGALTWGALSSSRGLYVAAFGGLLARSGPRRTFSWG